MTDREAETVFAAISWADSDDCPACPDCGCNSCYDCRRPNGAPRWRCKACHRDFSPTSVTLFAFHKLALRIYLAAIGIDWDGRRQVLGGELANRESRSSWRDSLLGLRQRGLVGIEFVVADDHAGLKRAIREVLPEAACQRCYAHFLRNALDDGRGWARAARGCTCAISGAAASAPTARRDGSTTPAATMPTQTPSTSAAKATAINSG